MARDIAPGERPTAEMTRVMYAPTPASRARLLGILWSENDGFLAANYAEIRPLTDGGCLAGHVVVRHASDYEALS